MLFLHNTPRPNFLTVLWLQEESPGCSMLAVPGPEVGPREGPQDLAPICLPSYCLNPKAVQVILPLYATLCLTHRFHTRTDKCCSPVSSRCSAQGGGQGLGCQTSGKHRGHPRPVPICLWPTQEETFPVRREEPWLTSLGVDTPQGAAAEVKRSCCLPIGG